MTDRYLQYLTEAKKGAAGPGATSAMPARPSFIKPIQGSSDRSLYKQMSDIINAGGGDSDINYTEDGLVELDYNELNLALDVLDELPSSRNLGYSAIIYGEAGIGKSAIISQRGKARAATLGREFIRLTDFIDKHPTAQELKAALPKYFIYIDENAGGMDPAMMSGIPDPTSPERKGYLTELPLPWVSIMTMSDEAAGFLFLDELNQAQDNVQNTLFDITNFDERTIARKYQIKGNWRIHCAGNWGEGYSIFPLVPALKERLAPFLLKLDFEGWSKWANSAKIAGTDNPIIHPVLMDFVADDPSVNFYDRPSGPEDATKRPNPRNLVAASGAIYNIIGAKGDFKGVSKDQWFKIQSAVGSICGKTFEQDFKQFVIANALIDVRDILREPSKLVKGPGANESQVTQSLAVFKRNLRNHVANFGDQFEAVKTDEQKDELVNLALNYLFVINSIFQVEANTASVLFSAIANKAMMNDLKIYRSIIVTHLREHGNEEGAKWVVEMIKEIITDVGGNVNAFMGKEEGEEEAEDEVTPQKIDPAAASKIANILSTFQKQLQSNTLPDYL